MGGACANVVAGEEWNSPWNSSTTGWPSPLVRGGCLVRALTRATALWAKTCAPTWPPFGRFP